MKLLMRDSLASICTYESSSKILKVKTCTCAIGKETCPSHSATDRSSGDGYFMHSLDLPSSNVSLQSASNSFATGSSVTVVAKPPSQLPYDELKLSLASLTSEKLSYDENLDRTDAFQRWLSEKNRQRKEAATKQQHIQQSLQQEKEQKLELERQNFFKWLNKKKLQHQANQKLMSELETLAAKRQEEKESRRKLAEENFQLWLRKKQEQQLAERLTVKLNQLQQTEQKQKRIQMSVGAYEQWLHASRHKPRPVPLNRGLESLKTSVSVSFINPAPWVPNIPTAKPSTK